MTVRIKPSFDVTLRIDSQAEERSTETGLAQLRRIVLGEEDGFPRPAAMALLAESDHPHVARDLERVLLNESESPRARYAAVMTLWRLGPAKAVEPLERALGVREESALAAVFTVLGRIGSPTLLPAIARARRRAKGFARAQAEFAAKLIAYRFGLPGHVVPLPNSKDFLAVPASAGRAFRVTRADGAEVELGLRSLARKPFGIDLSERDVFRLRCGGNDWLLLLSQELSAAGGSLLTARKAAAAVIASKEDETGMYSTRYLVLTAPAGRGRSVAVTVHRGLGELMFAGRAEVEGDEVAFALRSVKAQGAFPLRFSGAWTPGRLDAREAVTGLSVTVRRAPHPGLGPAVQKRSPPTPRTPGDRRKHRPS